MRDVSDVSDEERPPTTDVEVPVEAAAVRSLALAVAVDGLMVVIKLAAFAATGSAALLSEALHSGADLANQLLLAVGLRRSRAPADAAHPYGYGRERYVWAMLSATGVLFIGAGATFWNGLQQLLDPHPVERLDIALWTLATALAFDGISFLVALRAVRRQAGEGSLESALSHRADPVLVGILAEDGAAIAGVLVAGLGAGLAHVTGEPVFDALGAMGVGLVMGASALFLIDRNRRLLLGRSPAPERDAALEVLRESPAVREVMDAKATLIGPDRIRFKAEVVFDGRALAADFLAGHSPEALRERVQTDAALREFLGEFADQVVERLGDEVDRIEDRIQREQPEVVHIDIEVD